MFALLRPVARRGRRRCSSWPSRRTALTCRKRRMASWSVSATCCPTCRRTWTWTVTSRCRSKRPTKPPGRAAPKTCVRRSSTACRCPMSRNHDWRHPPPGRPPSYSTGFCSKCLGITSFSRPSKPISVTIARRAAGRAPSNRICRGSYSARPVTIGSPSPPAPSAPHATGCEPARVGERRMPPRLPLDLLHLPDKPAGVQDTQRSLPPQEKKRSPA